MKVKKRKFNLFKETFPKFPTFFLFLFFKYKLKDCQSILDLGCGDNSPMRFIDAKTYGVDAYKPLIESATKKGTHDELKILNVNHLTAFKPKSFDAVVALDLIEHLDKNDGYKLLTDMEHIARKKVVIFTPNGFMPQTGKSTYDTHRSGWKPPEMQKLGYKVYGMYGPKFFRGPYHKIRFQPELLFALISELIQWTYGIFHPKTAAAILCIKNKL